MDGRVLVAGLLFLVVSAAATTTTQVSKTDVLKDEWNRVLCIGVYVVQMLSVGIAALLIMVAGLRYMRSRMLMSGGGRGILWSGSWAFLQLSL